MSQMRGKLRIGRSSRIMTLLQTGWPKPSGGWLYSFSGVEPIKSDHIRYETRGCDDGPDEDVAL